jgi:hypothetical protein
LKSSFSDFLFAMMCIAVFWYFVFGAPKPTPTALKEYKDGIQNHLTWDIKGQCFFVRPNDDVTVYLIRVTDCDKK